MRPCDWLNIPKIFREPRIMILKFILFLTAVSASTIAQAATEEEGSGSKTKAHVYYCSDGDTCRLSVADRSMWLNVRLFGIDAPETAKKRLRKGGQPMGEAAKEFINKTIQDKDVMITQADLDPYNRPVVEIFLDNQSVNLLMVEKGYAEVYRGKTKRIDRKKFENAEKLAKDAKIGIWTQSNYISPANFRKANK